jgi:hypothetical protein
MPEQEDKLISGEFKSLGPPTREEAFNQYVTPQEELHGLSPADLENQQPLRWRTQSRVSSGEGNQGNRVRA